MKIFVSDLDGILLDSGTVFAKKWSEILGTQLTPEDFTNWKQEWALGIDPALNERFWEEVWYLEYEPYPGASQFVRSTRSLGYKFYVLTSRPTSAAIEALHRDLPKLGEYLDNVIICNQMLGETKSSYINTLQAAEFFLDDHIKNAVDVKINCHHLKEVMLFDRPWNKSADLCGYKRVYSYSDVLQQLAL